MVVVKLTALWSVAGPVAVVAARAMGRTEIIRAVLKTIDKSRMDSFTTMYLTEAPTSTFPSLQYEPRNAHYCQDHVGKAKDWYLHIGVGFLGPLVR